MNNTTLFDTVEICRGLLARPLYQTSANSNLIIGSEVRLRKNVKVYERPFGPLKILSDKPIKVYYEFLMPVWNEGFIYVGFILV